MSIIILSLVTTAAGAVRCGADRRKKLKFKEADDRQKQSATLVVVSISLIQSQSFRKSRNLSKSASTPFKQYKPFKKKRAYTQKRQVAA
jgi:hypothetical protein